MAAPASASAPPEPHHAATRPAADDAEIAGAQSLLERWAWGAEGCDRNPQGALVEALQGLSNAGFEPPEALLDRYAAAMRDIAEADV